VNDIVWRSAKLVLVLNIYTMKLIKTIHDFNKTFTTEDDCRIYIGNEKWKKGYACIRCGCQDYTKGRSLHYRRCVACKYDESPTANTLFHKCKMGLINALAIVYRISSRTKGTSSTELAKELGIQQKTAWYFRQKVMRTMDQDSELLKDEVMVDEFVVEQEEPCKRGRSLGKKKRAFIILEKTKHNKNGKLHVYAIENYQAETLSVPMEKHIDKNAQVNTDGYSSYATLKNKFIHLTQILSDNGKSHPQIHIQIMNLKAWIRGIHNHISLKYFQYYLNEFCYRFNNRNRKYTKFTVLLKKIINMHPIPIKSLILYAN